MRRIVRFAAADGAALVGTVDEAAGQVGVLIVSGGNEPRMGAHRGMAMLAAALADRGIAVFRFDRRGVGDSPGENGGFRESGSDIRGAALAFAAEVPTVRRIVGFGNCDAASALALFGRAAGFDAVVLANPWLRDEQDALPNAAAIRTRYKARLRDPRAWAGLLIGRIDLPRLFRGLRKVLANSSQSNDRTADAVIAGVRGWGAEATVVLAYGDATAIAFAAATRGEAWRVEDIDTASHSFAGNAAAELERIIVAAVHAAEAAPER